MRARVVISIGLALAFASAALVLRAFEAQSLFSAEHDPAELADLALARTLDAQVAAREIESALAANDIDLALSFLDLAREHKLAVDPMLVERVDRASSQAATALYTLASFGRGLVTGEPEDLAGFAGTAVGDLFVLGDIRDAVREGGRMAMRQQADEAVLALACVGL